SVITTAVVFGDTMITTVSTPENETLAAAAGAHHVVNYRSQNTAEAVRAVAPDGVDLIVEVAPVSNAALNEAIIARNGTVAIYASERDDLTIAIDPAMTTNTRFQIVLVYTMPASAKEQAIRDVQDAVAARALRVGAPPGLPLHRFPLEGTADAHAAVEANALARVPIDMG